MTEAADSVLDRDRLIAENEAISNAAQAIGANLQNRLRDAEAKHEAEKIKLELLEEMRKMNKNKSSEKHKKRKSLETNFPSSRDGLTFITGLLVGACSVFLISQFFKRKHKQ